MSSSHLRLAAAAGIALLCAVLLAPLLVWAHSVGVPVTANVYLVDRIDDDPSPAAQVCSAASNDCTLRGAVIQANANPGSTVVMFAGTQYTLTIAPAGGDDASTGDLNVTADMTITTVCLFPPCAATVVQGGAGWNDRIIDIAFGTAVSVHGITLRYGHGGDGGAIRIGATARVMLDSMTVFSNTGAHGGGIRNQGALTITASAVLSNTAANDGGGIYNNGQLWFFGQDDMSGNYAFGEGGGLDNESTGQVYAVDGLTIGNGTAGGDGGGIKNSFGYVSLSNTSIRNNRTLINHGGGIYSDGPMDIDHSAIYSNVASFYGGGITSNGPMTITNTTISGNKGFRAGGLDISGQATTTLSYLTIVNNIDTSNAYAGGIRIAPNSAPVAVANSIIALNQFEDGHQADCEGALGTLGYNLIQITDGCTLSGITSGNLYGVDPLVGPLRGNGGATWTHALLPGSPAIDNASPAACLLNDQRGQPRPYKGNGVEFAWCDIGAYEYHGPVVKRLLLPLIRR